jgi:hypothetical protein
MRIVNMPTGGRSERQVTIHHNFEDRPVSDDLIAGWAMAQVGEDPSRLFGWRVSRVESQSVAVVTMYTD